jgi:hypothetical protein
MKTLNAKRAEGICGNVILDKCKKNADDYSDFSSRLKIIQIPIKTLNEDCINYIKEIP